MNPDMAAGPPSTTVRRIGVIQHQGQRTVIGPQGATAEFRLDTISTDRRAQITFARLGTAPRTDTPIVFSADAQGFTRAGQQENPRRRKINKNHMVNARLQMQDIQRQRTLSAAKPSRARAQFLPEGFNIG